MRPLKITKKTTHDNCSVRAVRLQHTPDQRAFYDGSQYAELRCIPHNKQVQWLSKETYEAIILDELISKGRIV